MINLVVLISGSGSNLQAIIDAIESRQLEARISAVISNRPDAYGLQRAAQHGIETRVIDHTQFTDRANFDGSLLQAIEHYQPDLTVLAGFMRIMTAALIEKLSPNMVNIHPSLLPKYQGLHTHQRALDAGDREHGISIHIVTPELDAGPVLYQGRFAIENTDTAQSLQQKGHLLEHRMYPQLIQWISEKRLQLDTENPVFDNQPLITPLQFNAD